MSRDVDDHATCRHVQVPRDAMTLREVKVAVLASFEDQYAPEQVTLFTRTTNRGAPTLVSDDAAAKLLLSTDGDQAQQLLIVSAMNSCESELLVLPAVRGASKSTMYGHMAGPMPDAIRRTLIGLDHLFAPLPLPTHRDDWLAQFVERPQSVRQLLASRPIGRRREGIYLQPLRRAGDGSCACIDPAPLFEQLAAFLRAFFSGERVEVLPPRDVVLDAATRRASLLGEAVGWRDFCPANATKVPHGQLKAGELLQALRKLAPQLLAGRAGGTTPAEPICLLGVTMEDMYSADDDLFTAGLANMSQTARVRAGVFSFFRYHDGGPEAGGSAELLRRACKTAAHEIMHAYGVTHCAHTPATPPPDTPRATPAAARPMWRDQRTYRAAPVHSCTAGVHRACLMQGTGRLAEDFAAPMHLCPVDVAKLHAVLGGRCEPQARYAALLAFCESQPHGWEEEAGWLRQVTQALRTAGVTLAATEGTVGKPTNAVGNAKRHPAMSAAQRPATLAAARPATSAATARHPATSAATAPRPVSAAAAQRPATLAAAARRPATSAATAPRPMSAAAAQRPATATAAAAAARPAAAAATAARPATSGMQGALVSAEWVPLNGSSERSAGFRGGGCASSEYQALSRCWPCYEDLPVPRSGDWLHAKAPGVADRAGQTVGDVANKLTQCAPSSSRRVMYLCPIGRVDGAPPYAELAEVLQAMYSLPVRALPKKIMDAEVVAIERKLRGSGYGAQMETPSARAVLQRHKPADAFCIVGYTMEDLCHTAKGFDFLFGQAHAGEGCGVFSFARYADDRPTAPTFFRRCAMVLCHEVGHLWRIKHCVFAKCACAGSRMLISGRLSTAPPPVTRRSATPAALGSGSPPWKERCHHPTRAVRVHQV